MLDVHGPVVVGLPTLILFYFVYGFFWVILLVLGCFWSFDKSVRIIVVPKGVFRSPEFKRIPPRDYVSRCMSVAKLVPVLLLFLAYKITYCPFCQRAILGILMPHIPFLLCIIFVIQTQFFSTLAHFCPHTRSSSIWTK